MPHPRKSRARRANALTLTPTPRNNVTKRRVAGASAFALLFIAPAFAGVTTTGQLLPQLPDGNNYHAQGLLVVGDDAPGTLNASAGANVSAAGVVLARQATGAADLLLTGTGTTLDTTGDLVIADAGHARLRVFNNARITTGPAANLILSALPSSAGQLDLNGAGRLDIGAALIANQFAPNTSGGPAITLDNASRLRVGTAVPNADAWLNQTGTHPLHVFAAGTATRIDVNGSLHVATSAPATVELIDRAHLQLRTLNLGVASGGTLILDHATANASALNLGTQAAGHGKLTLLENSQLNIDAAGTHLGLNGQATVNIQNSQLTSLGPVQLDAHPRHNRLTLQGPDAQLHTFSFLTLGNSHPHPQPSQHATLTLDQANINVGTFMSIEQNATLRGQGQLTLGDSLTIHGTVATSAGILRVSSPNPARFQNGTLDATWNLTPPDNSTNADTSGAITHGTLRFDTDARLDGTLIPRRDPSPATNPPLMPDMYTPWTLIDTADSTHQLSRTFDRVLGLQLDATTAWAVTYDDQSVQAQRAILGDVTLDRLVDQADLDTVLQNWGTGGANGITPATWVTGDTNGDGTVRQADLDNVLRHWGYGVAETLQAAPNFHGSPLPEPAAALLALLLIFPSRRR